MRPPLRAEPQVHKDQSSLGCRVPLSFTLKSIQQMMDENRDRVLRPTHYGAVLIVVNLMNAIGFFALLLGQKHAVVPGYWPRSSHHLLN